VFILEKYTLLRFYVFTNTRCLRSKARTFTDFIALNALALSIQLEHSYQIASLTKNLSSYGVKRFCVRKSEVNRVKVTHFFILVEILRFRYSIGY
jgi:hypothetical protein